MRRSAPLVLVAWLLSAAIAAAAPLKFSISEGQAQNAFFQDGPIAAHINLTSRPKIRLITAFPAGNSGVGLWFAPLGKPATWGPVKHLNPAHGFTGLHGVTADVSIDAPALEVKKAVLGSVRTLREYDDGAAIPPEVAANPQVRGRTVTWARSRIDGAPGYALTVEVLGGELHSQPGGAIRFVAAAGDRLRLRLTAVSGEEPLTPIPPDRLLTAEAATDTRLANALRFLSYEQKLLAGSWRFDTYFGRDTLMSVRLLSRALTPHATEAALEAVLQRVNAAGEVAHEEEIGEYPILHRRADHAPSSAAPIYDYRPIDGGFMLTPVLAHYLLDLPAGRARAKAFLKRPGVSEALTRNIQWVMSKAAPFAENPSAERLVSLKPDAPVGEWRDSLEGLGKGRYPYDVNGVLVPAALESIARLAGAGLLSETALDPATQEKAASMAKVWTRSAPPLFAVAIDPQAARQAVADYAKAIGVDAAAADALPSAPLKFHAIALDAAGKPIPVMNSDEGFALLFLRPSPEELKIAIDGLLNPFPAGLMTDAGLVVANPAYADKALQPSFDNTHYHGTVIWSWQQALLAAGVDQQLARADLPADARALLQRAQRKIWSAIDATKSVQNSELWSWSFVDHHFRIEPFGQRGGDQTESDAAQLWSTVYLGLHRPGGVDPGP